MQTKLVQLLLRYYTRPLKIVKDFIRYHFLIFVLLPHTQAVSGKNECSCNEDDLPISSLIGNHDTLTKEREISVTYEPPANVDLAEAMDAGFETDVVPFGNDDVSSIILGSGFQPFKLPGEEAVKAFHDAVAAERLVMRPLV